MAKEILTKTKLQIAGGAATPAPPVGPALGQHGINIKEFTDRFNEKTKEMRGDIIPVEITIYKDRSFDFILKTPPAAELIKKAIKVAKGSGEPNKTKVGKITWAQCLEIAERKMPDLNAFDVNQAAHMVAGTARSMGIEVTGKPSK